MEFKRPRSSRRRLRPPKIQWPASNKDILKLFTLSRTNQILRGRSPILQDKEGEFKDQGVHKAWSELVASEILSAKVDVVPKPLEYNVGIVSSDPRKGRYVFPFFYKYGRKKLDISRLWLVYDQGCLTLIFIHMSFLKICTPPPHGKV